MSIEAMKLALEALLDSVPSGWSETTVERRSKAITALRAAILQAEKQEPVAWPDAPKMIYLQVCEDDVCQVSFSEHVEISWCQDKINESDIAYYRADIAPPQREWQNAALRIGEELSSVGPDGYYAMSSSEWLDWALAQNPKGKTLLQQHEWIGLTDEEVEKLVYDIRSQTTGVVATTHVARAIEAKLKEKNT